MRIRAHPGAWSADVAVGREGDVGLEVMPGAVRFSNARLGTASRAAVRRPGRYWTNGERRKAPQWRGGRRGRYSPALLCHSYSRRLLDLPKPQDEHSFFFTWYDFSPQRRHLTCVVLFFFPWLGVPAPVMG